MTGTRSQAASRQPETSSGKKKKQLAALKIRYIGVKGKKPWDKMQMNKNRLNYKS